jgi:hypothetical protein
VQGSAVANFSCQLRASDGVDPGALGDTFALQRLVLIAS